MRQTSLFRLLALLLALALVAAACGGDDGDDGVDAGGDDTADDGDAAADDGDDGDDGGDGDAPAAGDEAEGDVDTEVEAVEESPPTGGSIIVGLEAESTGLRPWEDTCSSPCANILFTLFDPLVERDVDGNYVPYLLESLSSNDDFTVWSGTLRSGVVFNNGDPLTAQTIADMFPIQASGATGAGLIASVNLVEVNATGELSVEWVLSRGSTAFPAALSAIPLGLVFHPEAAADLEAFNENPIGTGPFMLESRDLDNETVVVRNPLYWFVDRFGTQLPYLDSIAFRPIPDEGTRLDALLSGTTDVAQTLRQGTIRDARAARDGGADIFLFEFQGNNVGGGMYNVLVPPFDDVRVRRGLVHMNSQENVIEALGGTGISLPGTQFFSPDSPWWSQKVADAWPQFDFAKGVELLTEYVNDPGRSDGKAVGEPIDAELSCPPDPTLIAAMQVIEQVWTESGLVNVNLTNYDQQTHIGYALGGDNGFVGSHTTHCWRFSGENDPSLLLDSAFAPPTAEIAAANGLDGIVSPLNFPNYFSLEMFGNLQAATQTDVFEERYALYEAVMMELAEQVPLWYSGHTATALIVDASIKGLNSWEFPDGTLGIGHPSAVGRWGQAWLSAE
ncbi:MAG: ABC transporter substrate-binding protein [Acidimicrobiales bacterium]